MTICNKIQTLGETMETNLNARGVSCTFGTGTGESTVLDMVEMVNGTNFKGSSDVNLKICANRPYLMTGETTDVVVKLEDGLCEPLKNKNVIVGKSIFQDVGTTSNYSNWDTVASTMQMTRQDTYTELKRKTDATSFGYIVKDLSVTDGITIEFDFKQATIPSANDQYFSFRDSQGNTKLGISRNYQSLNDGEWHHYRFDINGLTVTPTIDGVQKSNLTLSDSWSRIQLEARNNAVQHFKNFVIYENINGVTDEKGEFALYNVSVTDDTTFTATYGTETATTNVYLCQFVDYGITSKHNDNWANLNSYMTVTRNDMYTTLTPTVNYSQNRYILPNTPTQPFVIEFDKHNTSMTGAYFIIGNVAIQFSSSFSGNLASAKHLKFTIQDDKVTCEHDGVVEQTQLNLTSLNDGIRFQINNNNDGNVIQYKNFRVR